MIKELEIIHNKRVVIVSCDEKGCSATVTNVAKNGKPKYGAATYLDHLRGEGWSIGFRVSCPTCNTRNGISVKCTKCGKKVNSRSYQRGSRPIQIDLLKKRLREDGWKAGKTFICPSCLSEMPRHIRSFSTFTIRFVDGDTVVAEHDFSDGDYIGIEVFGQDDCTKPVTIRSVEVGARGGLYLIKG